MKITHIHYKRTRLHVIVWGIKQRSLIFTLSFSLSLLFLLLFFLPFCKIIQVMHAQYKMLKQYRMVLGIEETYVLSAHLPSPPNFSYLTDGETYPTPFNGCILFCTVSHDLFIGCQVSFWNIHWNCCKSSEEMQERYKLGCLLPEIPFYR